MWSWAQRECVCPFSPGKQLRTCATRRATSRLSFFLMLQNFQARCCFDLGPSAKKSPLASLAVTAGLWGGTFLKTTLKKCKGKYPGEDLMRKTKCVPRIQLDRVETLPERFKFWKKGGKRHPQENLWQCLSVVVLVSQGHHVPSTDCLWLIFCATWQKKCHRSYLWAPYQAMRLCLSLLAQETRKPIKTPRISSSSGGSNLMMTLWSRAPTHKVFVIVDWCGLGETTWLSPVDHSAGSWKA